MFSQKNNSILGIVAEYNPFHKGHAYHIAKARELTGAKYCIVIMSGDFTQRGTPALFDKYIRTRMALEGGADLVIELPCLYATSSAEGFASGAVSILNRLNCIDYLCFGSECGSIDELRNIISLYASSSPKAEEEVKTLIRQGYSYPSAMEKSHGCPDMDSALLRGSNNILAMEYLKALDSSSSSLIPVTIPRRDNGYTNLQIDTAAEYASASSIRQALSAGDSIYKAYVPHFFDSITASAPRCVFNNFSDMLYIRLLELKEIGYTDYLDVSFEISSKILKNLNDFTDIDSFISLLKSKNLTQARLARCLTHILLDIKKDDAVIEPSYARILGFKKDAADLPGILKEKTDIELISKMADAKSSRLLDLDIRASALYSQANGSHLNEYRSSPIII